MLMKNYDSINNTEKSEKNLEWKDKINYIKKKRILYKKMKYKKKKILYKKIK